VGVDPAWGAPAPVAPAWGPATEVTPADGAEPAPVAGVERVTARPQAIDAAPGHTPLVYAGAIPPPVAVPVFPSGGMPVSEPVALDPAAPDVGTDGTTPSAKRFLGMQLRRPRRGDAALDGTEVEQGPQAPVAAWPTDVGLPVVATAEPATPAPWGPPALPALPAADGSSGDVPQDDFVDLLPPVDAPRAEARPLDEGPVDSVPAEAAPADAAPVDVTPIEAAPVESAPVESAPVEPVDAAPVETAPVEPPPTPMPLPAADEELRSLRTSFEASEARRTAAEQRADNAVAYAQQLQAQLTQVTADLEGRLQAAETRTRTVANEAQDWQIRHREAQAQIAELAMSLAGAEERLAAVRDERDDLMTQLEQATDPSRDEVAAELDA
jgi:hypothetical protein